jgi:DNA-binding HxlR family transcriptional regulator
MGNSYNQFCPTLDTAHLRELMADLHSFNDIYRGVPLISRAVLVARLRELENHGLIERRPRADGTGREYWLTPAGNAFRSVVNELGHWGLTHARDRLNQKISIRPSCCGDFASGPSLMRYPSGVSSSGSSSQVCRRVGPSSGSCGYCLNGLVWTFAPKIPDTRWT